MVRKNGLKMNKNEQKSKWNRAENGEKLVKYVLFWFIFLGSMLGKSLLIIFTVIKCRKISWKSFFTQRHFWITKWEILQKEYIYRVKKTLQTRAQTG